MRASSAGSTQRQANGLRIAILALSAVALAVSSWIAVVPAGAAGGPELLRDFGETGTGAGATRGPRGVATDPDTGHVFVAEVNNRRISEFTAWGEFVKAWGWDVAGTGDPGDTAPTNQFEICTVVCQTGIAATAASAGAGQLSSALGVAVDSAGDVYVVDSTVRRIQKFSSAGEFLLMFGGGVNKTTGENVCTKAQLEAGNVCGAGTTGTGEGQFGAWKIGSFIAVGPSDTVYVGDNNRIQQFNPDGTVKAPPIALPETGFVESLAVDPSGDLYVASDQSKAPGIRKLSPAGTVLDTITTAVNGEGEPVTIIPKALATDASGNLYVADDPPDQLGQPPRLEIFKFNPAGEQRAAFGAGEFTASTAMGTNPIGDVYVANSTPTNSYIRAYGPLPTVYGPPPSVPPTIGAQYATSVGTTSAILEAELNPHFFPTTYYVEYGSADCEVSPCTEQPAAPGAPLTGQRDRLYPSGGVSLAGLTPGATYHYRFVAISEAGTVFGPDRTFKTHLPGAFALPDGRAFEMVSPPADKNSAELGVPGNSSGLVQRDFSFRTMQASLTGEAIAYPSFTVFGDAQSASAANTYLSKRGAAGWSTANITPANRESSTKDPLRGFSADLSFAAVIQREPTLDPAAAEGFENLYLRDNRTGGIRALTTETPRGPSTGVIEYCVGFGGASANSDRVIFAAKGALTPDAPETSGISLYEWSAGQLSLVSVLPDGTPAEPFGPGKKSGFGAGLACAGPNLKIAHNAISADGSRIFWTYQTPSGITQLLARLDGTDTIQLDAAQGGPGPDGNGEFWAASDDGSKVFFTSPNSLTSDASPPVSGSLGDLYLYDFDAAPGEELSDLTVHPTPGANPSIRGVLGASEDGSYVYFVANGVLDEGASAGEPNLYVWHAGEGVDFIATLSEDDHDIHNGWRVVRFSGENGIGSSWTPDPSAKVARVTPDGRHLAFASLASLTGYDSVSQSSGEPVSQVYLYSADSDELVCASCNPSGARPLGFSEPPVWISPYEQPRYLSDDGGRLFFLSFDALTLRDTNGRQDVYEFEREGVGSCSAESATFNASSGGCLYLISTGASGDDSFFLDASSDGRDVFFSTRQRLFAADEDERYDIYDARVGGGFPPPPPPPAICAGEACRSAQLAPAALAPASAGFAGEGNATVTRKKPRRCRKGERRVRRRGKVRCVKHQSKKRAQRNRRAAR